MSRMYTCSPSELRKEIVTCISKGVTPLITSSPGVGKSSLVAQIAKEFRLKLIDFRLSQCTPEDLQGFPMRNGNKATFTPFDVFPLEGEELPDHLDGGKYDGWLLFLDELTSATKPVQAAAYKLILDRMVGSFRLHQNVAIVGAGNKVTDKAVVNQMSTALQSRLAHFEMEPNTKEWVEIAYQQDFDHRVIGFINYMPSKLMDFRPDHQDCTFPCPRTYEFLSRLVEDEPEIDESLGARVASVIGEGAAVEFITFAKEYTRLPKFSKIVADPKDTPVPDEASTKYAAMSMLIENFDEKTLDPVIDYVGRFDIEFQVIFCRGAVVRNPMIRSNHTGFGEYLKKMVRYLQ